MAYQHPNHNHNNHNNHNNNESYNNLYYLQQLLTILGTHTERNDSPQTSPSLPSSQTVSRSFGNVFSRLVTSGLRTYLNRRYDHDYSVLFDTFLQFYMGNNENDDEQEEEIQENENNRNNENKEYTGKVICLIDMEPGDVHYEEYQRYKECSICFEEFDKYSQIAITSCHHCYHLGCINKWIRFQESHSPKPTCPLCRTEI